MRKLVLLEIVIGAVVLTAVPVSIAPSPRSVVQLSLNTADAQYVAYRRPYRRAYRRAYYDYRYGSAYGYPAATYGLYPTYFGRAYRVMPWWW